MKLPVLAFGLPSGMEWVVLAVIGLLLFGRRLPGIARSLGSSVVEFKKGIQGVKDDIDEGVKKPSNKEAAKEQPRNEPAESRRLEAGANDRIIDVESKATMSSSDRT